MDFNHDYIKEKNNISKELNSALRTATYFPYKVKLTVYLKIKHKYTKNV